MRDQAEAALAIFRRDLQIFLSYRGQAVSHAFSAAFSIALFYYISRLLQIRDFESPDAYFAFVVVGLVIMAVLHRGMGLGLNVSFLSASAAVIIGVGAVLAAGYPDPGSPLATSDITASLFVILPNIVACIVVYLRVVRKASPERRATDAATGG